MARKLRAIRPDMAFEIRVEKIIINQFYLEIFDPLVEVARKNDLKIINAKSAVITALNNGTIAYDGKAFTGKFNSKISKELRAMGAKLNRRTKAFDLPKSEIPADIISSITSSNSRFKKAARSMLEKLAEVDYDIFLQKTKEKIAKAYTSYLGELDAEITVNVQDAISVMPQITDSERQEIAKEYSENLSLYIQDFTDKEILQLREIIESNTYAGNRAEALEKQISQRFGVTERKARFLARQETALLSASFQKSRYKDAGIKQYQWSSSHDSRVRPDHKELDGKIFSFDQPPVSDKATGKRANPSEDFGCRCVAIPIIP